MTGYGMRCGQCGFQASAPDREEHRKELFDHIATHPPRVITDLRELFPADAFGDTDGAA